LARTVSPDGVGLEMVERGARERPAIVFVHGYPDNKELWSGVLDALGDEFLLVAYDVRGAGGSDAPRGPAAYDLSRLGDDLLAVLDALAPDRAVHLVGHDWGGIQSWEFVTEPRFDGRLASFTAIAAPSLDQVALGGRSLRALARAWRSWYILALLAPGVPTLVWRVLLAGGRWQRLLHAREGVPLHPRPTLPGDALHGANLYRRNIPRRLLAPRRDAIARAPVQLIVPAGDRYISPSYYARAEQHAPALRRHVVGGGHWLPRTQPELVARLVAEFVRELEAGEEESGV
jgi:pimeloyl-ACP methyl ester carboxylesterase